MAQHTAPDEQRRLVECWRRSDASIAAFARAHGVRPGTFSTWIRRHPSSGLAVQEPAARSGFVQLVPPAEPFSIAVGAIDLRFEEPPPARWFASVLRELQAC